MKPTLPSRQLRALAALAQHRSFTNAAKELRVTQSAVSHAIQTLERSLGVRLVNYTDGCVSLTPPGKKILSHVTEILSGMHAICTHARAAVRDEKRVRRRPQFGRYQRAA